METIIRAVGNSFGVLLPKALLDTLNFQPGDVLSVYTEPGDTVVLRKVPAHIIAMRPEVESLLDRYTDVFEAMQND